MILSLWNNNMLCHLISVLRVARLFKWLIILFMDNVFRPTFSVRLWCKVRLKLIRILIVTRHAFDCLPEVCDNAHLIFLEQSKACLTRCDWVEWNSVPTELLFRSKRDKSSLGRWFIVPHVISQVDRSEKNMWVEYLIIIRENPSGRLGLCWTTYLRVNVTHVLSLLNQDFNKLSEHFPIK